MLVALGLSSSFAQNNDRGTHDNEKFWTWKNSVGQVETAEALKRILDEHALWISYHTSRGSPADLKGADLTRADLKGANLEHANLSGAVLGDADLRGANLQQADLSNAFLAGANLTNADLTKAYLFSAYLNEANLSGANLTQADLSYASLVGAKLDDANFYVTTLRGARYEPKSNPDARAIAYASDLESVTYAENSGPLSQLRKQFQDNGFREAERKITYALNRRRAQFESPTERWFKTIAFDWSCQYGMSPGRALRIWATLFLFCCLIYAVFIHFPGRSGLYRIDSTKKDESREEQVRPWKISSGAGWLYPLQFVAREGHVIYWAIFFSLMSAFNIGFRDINFGRWLRLLPRTEFDLRAKGWMRTVAGFQSLLSVYLIALWVLSYFGRPFE